MKIDSYTAPTPSALSVDIEPIVKAERTETGEMFKEFIAEKRKLNVTWSYLSNSDTAALLTSVNPNFVDIEYEDPKTGTTRTGTFYAGPQSASVLRYSGGSAVGYTDVKINFIEK